MPSRGWRSGDASGRVGSRRERQDDNMTAMWGKGPPRGSACGANEGATFSPAELRSNSRELLFCLSTNVQRVQQPVLARNRIETPANRHTRIGTPSKPASEQVQEVARRTRLSRLSIQPVRRLLHTIVHLLPTYPTTQIEAMSLLARTSQRLRVAFQPQWRPTGGPISRNLTVGVQSGPQVSKAATIGVQASIAGVLAVSTVSGALWASFARTRMLTLHPAASRTAYHTPAAWIWQHLVPECSTTPTSPLPRLCPQTRTRPTGAAAEHAGVLRLKPTAS